MATRYGDMEPKDNHFKQRLAEMHHLDIKALKIGSGVNANPQRKRDAVQCMSELAALSERWGYRLASAVRHQSPGTASP